MTLMSVLPNNSHASPVSGLGCFYLNCVKNDKPRDKGMSHVGAVFSCGRGHFNAVALPVASGRTGNLCYIPSTLSFGEQT